jgi:large subunit ribosomal protein L3
MINTIYAKKVGMGGGFTPSGIRVAVTDLWVPVLKVLDVRSKDKHGYSAVRFKFQDSRRKNNKEAIREVRTDDVLDVNTEIKLEEFVKAGDKVNVAGIMKGKGFAGVVKRWHFKGQPRTHGQSDRERAPGSSGPTTTPGRVLKGKRRAGHLGNTRAMIKHLEVLKVDPEKRLITVKGSVPGGKKGNWLMIEKI